MNGFNTVQTFDELSAILFPTAQDSLAPAPLAEISKEQWLKERCGFVNGSDAKHYMGSGTKTAKMPDWTAAKIEDVGSGFLTAVKELYLEKAYGYPASGFEGSKSTDLGNIAEKWILQKVADKLNTSSLTPCNDSIIILPNTLRCTPDFSYSAGGKEIAGEIKCPTGWAGYASRVLVNYDNKHPDYYQHICEMLALKTDNLRYIVALPPKNPAAALRGEFEGNIEGIGLNKLISLDFASTNALLVRSVMAITIADELVLRYGSTPPDRGLDFFIKQRAAESFTENIRALVGRNDFSEFIHDLCCVH